MKHAAKLDKWQQASITNMHAYPHLMLTILIWSDKVHTEYNLQSHKFQVWRGLPNSMHKFINDQLVTKYSFIVKPLVSLPLRKISIFW